MKLLFASILTIAIAAPAVSAAPAGDYGVYSASVVPVYTASNVYSESLEDYTSTSSIPSESTFPGDEHYSEVPVATLSETPLTSDEYSASPVYEISAPQVYSETPVPSYTDIPDYSDNEESEGNHSTGYNASGNGEAPGTYSAVN
ncbi:hypothetical protein GGI23_004256 [Coemansia sp. RSA 2559]|nr:hypothetical protein GGI23_004256 [Coemansia sp. RSA 2559]KAJ2862402.1 hypothetical protein GGI22_002206 [Coemansia erecta]